MSDWSPEDLERIGRATELQLASRRRDGSLRPYVVGSVVSPAAEQLTLRLIPR